MRKSRKGRKVTGPMDKKLLSRRVKTRNRFPAPKALLLTLEFADGCRYTAFGGTCYPSEVIKSRSSYLNFQGFSFFIYKMEIMYTA